MGMKNAFHALVFCAIVFVAVVCDPIPAYGQGLGVSHAQVGTVVVKEREYFGKGVYQYVSIPGGDTAGFATEDCDFLTTWNPGIAEYELSRTWKVSQEHMTTRQKDVIQRILEVNIGEKTYRGELRDVGPDALELGLACIDLNLSPVASNAERLSMSERGMIPSSDQVIPPGTRSGTPILDEKGKVIAMLSRDANGINFFISPGRNASLSCGGQKSPSFSDFSIETSLMNNMANRPTIPASLLAGIVFYYTSRDK